MKKAVLNAFFLFCIALSLHAFPSAETKNRELIIYGIKGSSGIGLIRLFEEPPRVPGFEVKAEALAQADLVAARFISGEAKIGILPPNVAAKIASSGKNIKAAAVIGMGMLSLLSSDPQIRRLEDLRGKSVEVAGQGATPDYVFRRLLLNKGLNPDTDLRLGYSLAHSEIAQALIANRISTALLPEPFASMARSARPDLHLVTDIEEEWKQINQGENFPMTILAAEGNFCSENPGALSIIMESIKNSIEWTVNNPAEAALLAEKYEMGFPPGAAVLAIPRSNYVFIPAAQARSSLESLFDTFLHFSPVSIGGALPGDGFYLSHEN